eukprot:365184-Chlamydomonas_euryale.AAC.11
MECERSRASSYLRRHERDPGSQRQIQVDKHRIGVRMEEELRARHQRLQCRATDGSHSPSDSHKPCTAPPSKHFQMSSQASTKTGRGKPAGCGSKQGKLPAACCEQERGKRPAAQHARSVASWR